ncbi:unnamed protein product [Adineta ricciae]|uniref:Uncharacterized protein n=1 Tax=Adineta ricciae TaxID=249248 RepID=A0A814VE23_ADIRI|nr:unnamed protein product [Adineta ricciae]
MTTVEFGGGPTLEARRQFANLKDGSQVPRYTGHIHQLRYRNGHTYGEETYILSKEYPHLIRSRSEFPIVKVDHSNPYETREFPDGMLPGYTGYIPQRKYQLGNRYRVETNLCLSGTKSVYEKAKNQAKDLRHSIATYPKPQSVNSETVVKHYLDYHPAYHPLENAPRNDRRLFLEAPIPGYKGYIPRIRPTDTSVGLRYHEAVKKGLDRFASEITHSTTILPTQRDISTPNTTSSLANFAQDNSITDYSTQRLYSRSGMIPKYTGYLPQRKYRIGQTYGDTSRGLPVCSHSLSNYGDYLRSKTSLGMRQNKPD